MNESNATILVYVTQYYYTAGDKLNGIIIGTKSLAA